MDIVILWNRWNLCLILPNELVTDSVVSGLVSAWKLDCFDYFERYVGLCMFMDIPNHYFSPLVDV